MKLAYFTSKQIKPMAEQLLGELELQHRRPLTFKRPALLVLDMQDYFLEPASHAFVPSAPALVLGIQQLIEIFRQKELPVIFTQHINTAEDAGMMSEWWRDLITDDHPGAGISTLFEIGESPVIQKSQYDAFMGTDLDEMLESRSVTDVVITGVMTHLCCETTARSAFMHGYRVWFPVDGSATYHLEFHRSSLMTLSHGFASPVTVDELLAALSEWTPDSDAGM
ncbi:MAG: isochorismatase family protein [Gammaproteobacteria bacterium]|nr:isochorismatase family protein [Gammaproteobacteria bacterium]